MVREIKVMERRRRRSIIIDHLFGRRARAVFAGHVLARSDGPKEKKENIVKILGLIVLTGMPWFYIMM